MTMLDRFKPITKIVIPNYIREIKLSESQNPKYFEWNGTTIKSKGKKLWKKCINWDREEAIILNNDNITPKDLRHPYYIVEFRGNNPVEILEQNIHFELTAKQRKLKQKFILCEVNSLDPEANEIEIEKVVANPTNVGKPKLQVISGQTIYSSSIHEFTRNKIVWKLKTMYDIKFASIPEYKLTLLKRALNNNYPLWILLEIQDTIKAFNDTTKEGEGRRWDVDNRAYPYQKTFNDFLVNGGDKIIDGLIIDDDRLHISGNGHIFTPIDENKERKLIFHIYTDKKFIQ